MMILLATLIGIAVPAVNGWLLLGLLARGTRILTPLERWTAGAVIGLTLSMFVTFCAHNALQMPLSRTGFLAVQAVMMMALFGLSRIRPALTRPPEAITEPASAIPRWLQTVLWILVGSVIVKAIAAGTVFLFLTPTFLDDSLDNWNLRGKMFFIEQSMAIPADSEGLDGFATGVGSYPPAVPLAKAWVASLAGSWSDGAANGIHLFWYVSALILIGCTARRLAGRGWDLFAVYLLGSMPLYLMHGTNPYSDAFLSVHVLMAIIFPLRAMHETDAARRAGLLRIGAVCAGLLPFTKNEALLLYLPPLLLLGAIGLFIGVRRQSMTLREALTAVAWYAGCLLILALPWLSYKWLNGLTFGNAKPFSTVDISFQAGVISAIVVNTLFEGNWLLLFPLFAALVLWRWRSAFGRWLPLTVFILIVCGGQWLIFLFTSLSVEAKMQTGLARGAVQLMPLMTLLTVLLLKDAWPKLQGGCLALGRTVGIVQA